MLSCMIGTEIFSRVSKTVTVEKCLIIVLSCASATMFLSAQFASYHLRVKSITDGCSLIGQP